MFGALLTDLSKAFDCLDNELLIAKLNAYGFSLPALKLVHDYLSNRNPVDTGRKLDVYKTSIRLPGRLLYVLCTFNLRPVSTEKQRTKVNRTYGSWLEIVFGVPQGSILDPLLFNMFLADLFFILNDVDIANYANDNTPYAIAA